MLCLDKGCEVVGRDDLARIPTPPARKRHRPIPHSTLVQAIDAAAANRGIGIADEQWGISHGGLRLYGAVDLRLPEAVELPEGVGASIGLRHANDQSMSVQLIAGARVFVCSNGCFAGELETVRRRHTAGLDLVGVIGHCLDEYLERVEDFNRMHDRLANARGTELRAKSLIFDAFREHQVMAPKYLPAVADRYFYSDEHRRQFPERTRWGLYNAFTETFKQESVGLQIDSHRRLTRALAAELN